MNKSRIGQGFGFVLLLLFLGTSPLLAQDTPVPESPASSVGPEPTPTIDRLAAPPTVPSPTQADEGAQLFWLWCQPCHGDQGQGLTDEWREQYPVEDQNCWNRGCHGNIPYEDGFTLPKHVPAVIGNQSLQRFQTMDELYQYVHVKMPYEYPGALNEEEALAVTAYLARAHGKWEGVPLTNDNVANYRWQPLPTATPQTASIDEQTETNTNRSDDSPDGVLAAVNPGVLIAVTLGVLLFLGGIALWHQRR